MALTRAERDKLTALLMEKEARNLDFDEAGRKAAAARKAVADYLDEITSNLRVTKCRNCATTFNMLPADTTCPYCSHPLPPAGAAPGPEHRKQRLQCISCGASQFYNLDCPPK